MAIIIFYLEKRMANWDSYIWEGLYNTPSDKILRYFMINNSVSLKFKLTSCHSTAQNSAVIPTSFRIKIMLLVVVSKALHGLSPYSLTSPHITHLLANTAAVTLASFLFFERTRILLRAFSRAVPSPLGVIWPHTLSEAYLDQQGKYCNLSAS